MNSGKNCGKPCCGPQSQWNSNSDSDVSAPPPPPPPPPMGNQCGGGGSSSQWPNNSYSSAAPDADADSDMSNQCGDDSSQWNYGAPTGPTNYGLGSPTHRKARVVVINHTNQQLIGLSVVHKYSNVYKNRQEWAAVLPGQQSDSELTVDYNTGWATTGRDWWLITWFSPDLKTVYFSNPNNFRGLIDKLEKFGPAAIQKAAEAIAALATEKAGNEKSTQVASDLAKSLGKTLSDGLFNSESTEGFKQHILRDNDENQVTEIVINSDLTITFRSKSGTSNTVTGSKPSDK